MSRLKPYLRTNSTEINNYLDTTTGELVSTNIKHHKYLANTKEEFFLMYSSITGIMKKMDKAEVRVFGFCLRYVDGVEFDISKRLRLVMAKDIGINERTILNTLPKLVDKKLLLLKDNGLYLINPLYAFKGSSNERNASVKAVIELGILD